MMKAKPIDVKIDAGDVKLPGLLTVPRGVKGIVLFVHGSGSNRDSPRNQFVAEVLNQGGMATLLFDLRTREEQFADRQIPGSAVNFSLLADRVCGVIDWVVKEEFSPGLPIGLYGSSTGAAVALRSATQRPDAVKAIVSRGGRPDLASGVLGQVHAPTLLIVGGKDTVVLELNRKALRELPHGELHKVPGATHLFAEPGALAAVARESRHWFDKHFPAANFIR